MSGLLLATGFPYGAPELKQVYRKNLASALVLGIVLAYSLLGCYWGSVYFLGSKSNSPLLIDHVITICNLPLPPSLTPPDLAAHHFASATVKPSIGIPVPVPDTEVNPEKTIATQQEMNDDSGTVGDEAGIAGGQTLSDASIRIQDGMPPPDFRVVERSPVLINHIAPVYPEIARKADLEGMVYVKLWINKEGKVKQVVVIKSTSDIFIEPTVAAAQQFVFTPAMMHNGPVDVWVTLPFKFRLK